MWPLLNKLHDKRRKNLEPLNLWSFTTRLDSSDLRRAGKDYGIGTLHNNWLMSCRLYSGLWRPLRFAGRQYNNSPALQWRCYTRAHQVKWPDWKIYRPGPALPKCYHIWPVYLFYFDCGLCFEGDYNKLVNFEEKKCTRWGFSDLEKTWLFYCSGTGVCTRWPASRPWWPGNDLAALTSWRRHCGFDYILRGRAASSIAKTCAFVVKL